MSAAAPVTGVGALGGSGTRVVSDILQRAGLFFGDDQNDARDTLAFTLVFKRPEALSLDDAAFASDAGLFRRALLRESLSPGNVDRLHALAGEVRRQHDRAWLGERAARLIDGAAAGRPVTGPWGWKEPNTHMVADRLLALWPELRMVMVYRDGFDMALSTNRQQIRFWRQAEGGPRFSPTPRGALRYWAWAHRRMLKTAAAFPGRVLFLSFDRLCDSPAAEIDRLLAFAGRLLGDCERAALTALPRAPASRGRGAGLDVSDIDAATLHFVRSFDARVREAGQAGRLPA